MAIAPSSSTTAAVRHSTSMPGLTESRHDPLTGQWTIFAPRRSDRPDDFRSPTSERTPSVDCPFCAGNEAVTPDAVWAGRIAEAGAATTNRPSGVRNSGTNYRVSKPERLGHARQDGSSAEGVPAEEGVSSDGTGSRPIGQRLPSDAPDWLVRVVPNKFPAVTPLARTPSVDAFAGFPPIPSATSSPHSPGSLFRSRPVGGGHEVFIESPRHTHSLTELDLEQVELVFAAYQERIRHWRSVPGVRYISVFKNVGRDAGASLQHSHAQLIATNSLPSEVARIGERLERYRATTGCCLHCDLIRAELKEKRRVIAEGDSIVAYCPFASPMPYLVRITTLEHHDRFEDLTPDPVRELAWMTRRVIGWLEQIRPGIAYNYLLHTRPPRMGRDADAHHWTLEIFPRITQLAGFEFASHCLINPVMPETAAERFHRQAIAEDPRRSSRRQAARSQA